MKLKKLGGVIAGSAIAAALCLSSSAQFAKTLKLADGQFKDVKNDAWYASEVKNAYELGFMNGTAADSFSPDGSVTVAQGITMAARVHALNNGKEVPANSTTGNWYDNAVKYALENGIISEGQFDSYTRDAKRYEVAELFYSAMPADAYKAINTVYSIPDVSNASDYSDMLLVMYNAGIVMGSDEYGNFYPENNIKRSECAAIINRVALPENRLHKTLKHDRSDDAYTLCYNEMYAGYKEGINSGWVLDNRGGPPRFSIDGGYGALNDVSTEFGTAMIREFNPVYSGRIVTEAAYSVKGDGVFLEFRDVNDKPTYQIKTVDGAWKILGKDGKYTTILENAFGETGAKSFNFRIVTDLNTGKSTTYINNKDCGTYPLLSDSVLNFRFATDEKSTGAISGSKINIVVNYGAYEDFTFFGPESVYGWNATEGAKLTSGELTLDENSSAVKSFDKIGGKVVGETYFILPDGGAFSYTLKSGDTASVTFAAKNGKFYANDKEVYTYTKNMWYRLRIEADTKNSSANVLLNGRSIGEVKLGTSSEIDKFEVKTGAATTARLDFMKVYGLVEHADYVPEPTAKANLDDYVVGLNICSLWRNGTHFGWSCVTPYDEPKTVLGYYDEGMPESADWEIKYMVEHGIDFQAFCWYSDLSNAPLKDPRNGEQLHNGYMYSKYSDYMKYTLIWEAANSARFHADAFRNYVIPYWFENYFLDDRYLKLDNKIILCLFGANWLSQSDYFGSAENAKAELDYLDEVAKSYGFDGVVILACGGPQGMGIEGNYAYNWGAAGKSLQINKDRNLSNATSSKTCYTVPTISVGFDSIPWHGTRNGIMTVEDFDAAAKWVKDSYLPRFQTKGTWNERLVMLSTWNEYGEGTYIMPSGLNGFGYLDAVRKNFTNLPDEHEDKTPTAAQSERFNHLYPQYARLLRRQGWLKYNNGGSLKIESELYVNDLPFISEIPSQNNAAAGILYPFDPATGEAFALNVHYTWRKGAGYLKIEGNKHTVEYLVGSSKYTVDGTEKDLGYTLYLSDGLPMISFKALAEALGYTSEVKDGNTYVKTTQYDIYKSVANREVGDWEFNDFDTEGWTSTHMSLEVRDGAMTMTVLSDKNNDPIMTRSQETKFDSKLFKEFEIRMRYKFTNGEKQTLTIYFITDRNSQWDEVKTIRIPLEKKDTDGEWVYYKVDLTKNSAWKNTITNLRFDPFNSPGYMEIDYMRFIKDPDYVPSELRPFEIENGNAEDTSNATVFYSNNAKVTIAEEPGNTSNHVWYVTSAPGKNWTYFRQAALFKKGKKYNISFDVKLVGDNANKGLKEAVFNLNIRYPETGALNNFDHLIKAFKVTTDGWTHVEAEHVVAKMDSSSGHEFAIYANPSGDASFTYMVDNIVVAESDSGLAVEDDKKTEQTTETKPDTKKEEAVQGEIPALTDAGLLTGVTPYSDNAVITSVDDPKEAGKKVYCVTPKAGEKRWTYFRAKTDAFESEATYKFSYDVLAVSSGANTSGFTAQIMANFRYKSGDKNDHVVNPVKITPSEGWIHVEFEYKLEAVTDPLATQEFTLYTNPNGEDSVTYLLKNVKLEKKA